jgi:hypothetical protein
MTQHSAATLRKRQVLTRVWAGLVIVWSVVRAIVIWAALRGYGFNPWIYLGIDLVCSIAYAVTTPRLVLRFVDDRYRSAINWGVVSLVAYIIPDIYIFVGTRTLPTNVVVILCVVIVTMLVLAVVAIARKVRKGRAERQVGETTVAVHGRA